MAVVIPKATVHDRKCTRVRAGPIVVSMPNGFQSRSRYHRRFPSLVLVKAGLRKVVMHISGRHPTSLRMYLRSPKWHALAEDHLDFDAAAH